MEKLFEKIPLLFLLDLEQAVIKRRQGRPDRDNRDTADEKEQIQDHNIRDTG